MPEASADTAPDATDESPASDDRLAASPAAGDEEIDYEATKYDDVGGREHDELSFMEEHWGILRNAFKFARISETEDQISDMYVDLLGPRGKKGCDGKALKMPRGYSEQEKIMPRWNYKNSKDEWHLDGARYLTKPRELVEEDELLPKIQSTTDKYTIVTWYFLRTRAMEELREIAKRGFRLFFLTVVQVLLCATIWGLGSTEIDGGRLEVVIASFAVGIVGIIAQCFGFIGSLSENEDHLRKYWIGQLWLLSIVIVFLYTEIHHVTDNRRICSPSKNDFLQGVIEDDNCSKDEDIILAALILNAIQMLLTFVSIYNTSGMLDSINDKTTIDDNIHVFKYFQIYTSEVSQRLLGFDPHSKGVKEVEAVDNGDGDGDGDCNDS